MPAVRFYARNRLYGAYCLPKTIPVKPVGPYGPPSRPIGGISLSSDERYRRQPAYWNDIKALLTYFLDEKSRVSFELSTSRIINLYMCVCACT